MLRAIHSLVGYKIKASDGDIGKVDQFLFDERQWMLRYLVVETGHWLKKRKVILSPIAIERSDWLTQHLHVSLTRAQVENSPDLDTEQPISRAHEIEIFDYYKWPYYWLGEGFWGPHSSNTSEEREMERHIESQTSSEHLYSTREFVGCHIQARDKEFGHIEDLIVDQENWSIRYAVVATHNFWPGGRSVLLAPQWIQQIDTFQRRVLVDLDSETIKKGPQFDPYAAVNREYEVRLYDYYGRPKYWETELEHEHEHEHEQQLQRGATPSPLTPHPKT